MARAKCTHHYTTAPSCHVHVRPPCRKNTRGLQAVSSPKCEKEPSKVKKEPLKIAIDCNVKACWMLQILVNGMWKVAPKNKKNKFLAWKLYVLFLLQVLDLSHNNLSKDDVSSLGLLTSLKVLYLTGNQLRSLPTEMGKPFQVQIRYGTETRLTSAQEKGAWMFDFRNEIHFL